MFVLISLMYVVNAVLFVNVLEDFTFGVQQCGQMGFGPGNVTLELFD